MDKKNLTLGVFFAIAACVLWGFIFIIPCFLSDYNSFEIVIGRYLFYGSLSTFFFLHKRVKKKRSYPRQIWLKALYYCLVSTIGYYTCLVLSVKYSSPDISALIVGISPIVIALYGNWQVKETTFKSLILPSTFIFIGLGILNVPEFMKSPAPTSFLLGLLFSFGSLFSWSWFVIENSKFLKKHPHILSNDWATLIGVASFFWVIFFMLLFFPFIDTLPEIKHYLVPKYLAGSAFLGLFCSWVGALLWNKATLYLPVSLAGQLTIFETIFALIYYYVFLLTLPSWHEVVGVIILLSAITYGIRKFSRAKDYSDKISPH